MKPARLIREPLFHFLAAGLALFLILSALKPPEQSDTIVVDRDALLTFIQYRSRAFESGAAAALFESLAPAERQRLIDDFIREEALFRESEKLGLADGDYVIRRRLVQKLEFMTEAAAKAGSAENADSDAAEAYLAANPQLYTLPESATFTHVFLSARDRTPQEAFAAAETMKETLIREGAAFTDAPRFSERFLFHLNYIERTRDYVQSHFGATATAEIFSTDRPLGEWYGPIASVHGAHLVMVNERQAERLPPLSEIRDAVNADAAREAAQRARDRLIDLIVAGYSVSLAPDLK